MSVTVEALVASVPSPQLTCMVPNVKLGTAQRRIELDNGCQWATPRGPALGLDTQPVYDLTRSLKGNLDFFQFEARWHCDMPRLAYESHSGTTQKCVLWFRLRSGFDAFELLDIFRSFPVRQTAKLMRCT